MFDTAMHTYEREHLRLAVALRSLFFVILTHGFSSGSVTAQTANRDDQQPRKERPNIIILLADDLGYGDLGCYGHPTIRTPNLDRMAREGVRLTRFYTPSPQCTPSRAALLTGMYPVRCGLPRLLFRGSERGIPDEVLTLAEALKSEGYATACIGKWHLGERSQFLPTKHGFDRFFGLLTNPGRDRAESGYVPLLRLKGLESVEAPVELRKLTQRFTEEAIHFMSETCKANASLQPFFLYLAYTAPHVPLHISPTFEGRSPRGRYGDVIEELDWSAGRILQSLRDLGIESRTLVLFTSDNGPYLEQKLDAGSAGLLRGGKGSTWEGGCRLPCIVQYPTKIPGGKVYRKHASMLDVFPTMLALAGAAEVGTGRLDGQNLLPALLQIKDVEEIAFFYYRGSEIMAVSRGPWKLHLKIIRNRKKLALDPPLLYNLDHDPSERVSLADEHPQIVAELKAAMRQQRELDQP